jgi:ABC-type nitrate/sulfonate/bicarbonate transport system substrate-binding protein
MIQRWTALREGTHSATLLSSPYNIVAKDGGFVELAIAADVTGPYLGNAGAARRSWASRNRLQLVAFIRAYRKAIEWLYEPSNRHEAVEILLRHLPQMSRPLAEASYEELLHPERGFFKTGGIGLEAMRCVLELRSRYGKPSKQLSEPMKYCDLSYLAEAQ